VIRIYVLEKKKVSFEAMGFFAVTKNNGTLKNYKKDNDLL